MAREAGETEREETQKVRAGKGKLGSRSRAWGVGGSSTDVRDKGPDEKGWGRGPRAEDACRDG